jgi:GNAT superfamily N-acetyltransferase
MAVQIKEVLSRRDLRRFVRFPYKLYANNLYWVPPLRMDELNTLDKKSAGHDYCETRYWLAYQNQKIVGRIAGIINHKANEKWNEKHIRFGWIDFIDDEEVVRTLFEAVEAWGRSKGLTAIHGPLGFTDMDNEGMLIEGFEELGTLATIYNYPYYPVYLEKLGFQKDIDWMEFEATVPARVPEKIIQIAHIVEQKLKIRLLRVKHKKEVLPYAHQLFEVLNITYKNLYGFVELSEAQIQMYIKQYFGFIKTDFIALVLDANDRVIGFGITMPSLSRALQKSRGRLLPFGFLHLLKALKNYERIDLYLVGVLPEYQGKGVNAVIMADLAQNFIRMGVKKAETNPELENNYKIQSQWKLFDMRQHKRRRCYIKPL